ncbi:SpaA isopeptide-forming pilin-related protein [Blautia sp. HCP3S3_H10_1]|uniref:SpaA isopeptide-forming pilin-related protein n=1 Tax=unclassified Blautia TaxID=2648079 RepID=UPI003F8E51DC
MKNTLRKRIMSGLLAGVLFLSNTNVTAGAEDMGFISGDSWESQEAEEGNVTGEEDFSSGETGKITEDANGQENDDEQESGELDSDQAADSMEGGQASQEVSATVTPEEGFSAGEGDAEGPMVLDEEGDTPESNVASGYFRVTGSIAYDETLDGTDWKSLVRPSEFEQPITVTLTYKDSDGNSHDIDYNAQSDLSKNDFYLKFVHDGDGGGDFTIENVPKNVTVDGVSYNVTFYSVNVKPNLPYYESGTPISGAITDSTTAGAGTLYLKLKSQTLTLNPTVTPEGTDNPSFNMKVSYHNQYLTDGDRKLELSYNPVTGNLTTVYVPIGIKYEVTQEKKEGYRLDAKYSTVKTENGKQSDPMESSGGAEGIIEAGTDVKVTTVNYAQNVSVDFDVKWIDNNNVNRPTLTRDNFVLKVKTDTGEWTEVTSENYSSLLNIEKEPGWVQSTTEPGKYSFTGLPAVDANGKNLSYQVEIKDIENENYLAVSSDDETTGKRTFTLEEQTDFSATIVWNDSADGDKRPKDGIDSLKLYRKTGNGNYEPVYDELPEGAVTMGAGGTWSVKLSGIPRYDENNQEYDYVLVQGSITNENGKDVVNQNSVDNYKTYYNNGTGSFGNDTALCHNNGTITEVLYEEVDFSANKVWKDPDGAKHNNTRPDATVKLWRYIKSEAKDIDEAYSKGVAAQVVFQTKTADGTVKENIVSYNISKETDSAISFTNKTVPSMPEGYQFPAYDDQGRQFVYFVRETLSGTNEEEYDIQYTAQGSDGNTVTYKNGAPINGTISNVRRKKEAVAITKLWQNRSGLTEIDGASVTLKIRASADGGKTYDDLIVYSDKNGSYDVLTEGEQKQAQTITGFTAGMPEQEIIYYVNTCNSEGAPYDMTTAKLIETVKIGNNICNVVYDANGDGTLELNGKKYIVKTSYEGEAIRGDNMQQYRYKQTNTISEPRDYTLIKAWDNSITDEAMKDIISVKFKLERRTTKDKTDGTEAAYVEVPNGNSNLWTVNRPASSGTTSTTERTWTSTISDLPRYDDEGYEYYYRATEVSFVKEDGTILTVEQARENSKWYGSYYRTVDQTKVTNYVSGKGSRFFTVSKIWQDNGDLSNRKEVTIRVYKKSDLKKELQTKLGQTNEGGNTENQEDTDDSEDTDGPEDIGTSEDSVDLTDIVDFSKLNSKYLEAKISTSNQNTTYIYYKDLERAIEGKEWANVSEDTWANYVVLEYCVGNPDTDGALPAQYSYSQLMDAVNSSTTYNLSGTVENTTRKYNTRLSFDDNNGSVAFLTNTRTGIANIDAVKTWKDNNNSSDTRPESVKFQLYQDGSAYMSVPDGVSVEIVTDVKADENQDKKEEENQSGNNEAEIENTWKAELDHATGIITITANEHDNSSKWHFAIKGLLRFSSTGIPHTYNLEEVALTNPGTDEDGAGNTETTYTYIQKKTATSITDDNKTQSYTFAFENTVTGTVSHVAYKYWNDAGVGASNRPDLYLNLYQYLKKDQQKNKNTSLKDLPSYKLYKDYKDQIWTTKPENPDSSEPEKGYNWKITIEGLPQFDENGNEYGYVFTETMNNGGKTVLGNYVPTSETKSGQQRKQSYEVFTNTITDYMTITGKKTWTGLSGYQTGENELPDPVITLYRTTDSLITEIQSKTDDEVNTLIKAGKLTKVDTTHLTGSKAESNDKTRYQFPDAEVTEGEINAGFIYMVDGKPMLPKFDSDGKRYTYLVRESITDTISSQLYIQVNTNGTLSNVFRSDVNRRNITVTKTWESRNNLKDGENKYPSVTYTLYRYEPAGLDEKGKIVEKQLTKIETHTINPGEFTGPNGEASYTFQNLLVYSPTGVQYCYYIVENSINGYSITYTDEPGVEDGTLVGGKIRTGQTADGQVGEITITEEILNSLKYNNRIDIISLPENWNKKDAENTVSVGTTNTYDQRGTVKLSGEKKWNDYDDEEGLRPPNITVTLTRRTNNETGQNNKVDSTAVTLKERTSEDTYVTTPYIVWDKGTDSKTSDKWSYTIYNLERYAPNGMPYIYTLAEEAVNGYKKPDAISKQADSNTVNMDPMTNGFAGSYYVRKNWMDGNNKYNLRPGTITIQLQRSTDNGNTWKDYRDPVTLDKTKVIKNTKNNSWEYQFTNLPVIDKNNNPYTYRCVETQIGGVAVKEITESDGTKKLTAGAYECRYTTQNKERTVIENTLDSTSLVVTKKWKGDQNNLYQSRPEQLTFVLQKRGVTVKNETGGNETGGNETGGNETGGNETGGSETGGSESSETGNAEDEVTGNEPDSPGSTPSEEDVLSDWNDVLDENGKPYTFTISAADNWTKKLEDLPTAEVYVGENGQNYTVYSLYFRAVEVHTDDQIDSSTGKTNYGSGSIAAGAQNYKDVTKYATLDNNPNHKYDEQAGCNESIITNQLILDNPPKSISVTKQWYRTDGDSMTATFELLYKTTDENEWHSYGEQKLQSVSSTKYGPSAVITWTDLPKYDRDGNELEYKVIEQPVSGYKTNISTNNAENGENANSAGKSTQSADYPTNYTFTNIELQDYTVQKIWQNTDYAEKTATGEYTATFQLQQKIEGTTDSGKDEWTEVKASDVGLSSEKFTANVTLSSKSANDKLQSYTWTNLPKYTDDGKAITYRALETKINGINVVNDSNGAYNVSYQYESKQMNQSGEGNETNAEDQTDSVINLTPSFGNIKTIATNRMIYGFVNLSKTAAYLAPGVTEDGKLQGIKFDIYTVDSSTTEGEALYVSDVETDSNGNLINSNGKYGGDTQQQKYLISGTYLLKEKAAGSDFSVWSKGITFTVGNGNTNDKGELLDTGEHGTAWISTTTTSQSDSSDSNLSTRLQLKTNYKASTTESTHYFNDKCKEQSEDSIAVNLESRGVLSFTKTGPEKSESGNKTYTSLDTHNGATGESSAYFGVYLEADCNTQVAGMVPKANVVNGSTDKTTMVLTNLKPDGTEIAESKNVNGIPYLRAYKATSGNTGYDNYPFTLLSGTYYIKELVAPAGYKLDTKVRKAVISKIESTAMDIDLSEVYPSNKAVISAMSSEDGNAETGTGITEYQWSNTPNVVKIYKMDQFGRQVPLKKNGYLELKVEGDGNTFPAGDKTSGDGSTSGGTAGGDAASGATAGEDTIRLYQNPECPATMKDGKTKLDYVSYDTESGAWTITGLLDINKTYVLSEPENCVHDNYILAKPIRFQVNADGTIKLVAQGSNGNSEADNNGNNTGTESTADTVQKNDPLTANGNEADGAYKNACKPDANENILVLRDPCRYLKTLSLTKKDSETNKPIANISFQLFKYDGKGSNRELINNRPVLMKGGKTDDVYLTTGADGKIDLANLDGSIMNKITGCALKYGLDVGKYYWKEVERGASDGYRLAADIFFEIKPNTPTTSEGATVGYEDYAKITYEVSGRTDVEVANASGDTGGTDSDTGSAGSIDAKDIIVKNTPVTKVPKTLGLVKVDSKDNSKLAGAKFTLTYKSINHGQAGSATGTDAETIVQNCITGSDGVLYLVDEKTGELPADTQERKKPDISRKGSYILKETQAPEGYMTRTKDGISNVVTMVTFAVNSENEIIDIHYYNGAGERVTNPAPVVSADSTGEHIALNLTVKNEKTKVSIAKRNDIKSSGSDTDAGTKTCNQKDLSGELLTGSTLEIYEGTDVSNADNKKAVLGKNQSEWNWISPAGADDSGNTGDSGNSDGSGSSGTDDSSSTDSISSGGNGDSTDGDTSSGSLTASAVIEEGCLKENTIYTLHESQAPVGYLAADDIYFMLSGTTTKEIPGTSTVVSQLYVWTGTNKPTEQDINLNSGNWKITDSTSAVPTNLNNNVLTMVDEAIIAPVDMRKVVGTSDKFEILPGAKFEVKLGKTGIAGETGENTGTVLGTAISSAEGYLVWDSITQAGYDSKLIFNADGKRVAQSDENPDASVIGKTIILQQNASGYTFTETDAPDNAYNEGKSFTVNITAENYKEYRNGNTTTQDASKVTYDTTAYVNILEANQAKDTDGKNTYTVATLSHRTTETDKATASDLVNPAFEAHFQLYKYDAENSEIAATHDNYDKIGMQGVTFTLSKKQTDGSYRKVDDYTTGENGLLSIDIAQKGTYQLQETQTLTGYLLNDKVMEFTITNDDYKKTLTYEEPTTDEGTSTSTQNCHTKVVKYADGNEIKNAITYDLPNYRKHGTITLTKTDSDFREKLNGVKYKLTRTSPIVNAVVDKYFPSSTVKELIVETGKTYSNIAGATQEKEITITKGNDGVLTLSDLQWGTYTLTEVTELPGYKLELDQNNNVINTHTFTIGGTNYADGASLTFDFSDTNTKNSVVFYKTNQVDTEAGVKEADIKGLEGAVFEVHEGESCTNDSSGHNNCTKVEFFTSAKDMSNGKKVSTVTTGADGKVTIYGLPTNTGDSTDPANPTAAKTYHLVEVTAPKGYKLQSNPVAFTIDRQGKVQIQKMDASGNPVTDANGKLEYEDAPLDSKTQIGQETPTIQIGRVTMTDELIKLYIKKVGENGSTPLKGAVFELKDTCNDQSGISNCDHKLANGADSESIEITADDGTILIQIERVIGGHTYTLTETKAPDGYESTAVVTFNVKTDGTIDENSLKTSGGYTESTDEGTTTSCASLDNNRTTVSIKDELIRMSLTKVDYENAETKLGGVIFTLTPYGKVSDGKTDSSFRAYPTESVPEGLKYDDVKKTYVYTATTKADGTITFPDGLLKHDNSYLLQETATINGYYLGKEAKAGVILKVGKDGNITISRLDDYKDKKITITSGSDTTTVSSCPVTVTAGDGKGCELLSRNMKAASFDLTKKVEGNMGDLNGTFQINMKVYEPDGTEIGERTINLKMNEKYDSEKGLTSASATGDDKQAFGVGAIPVGATLVISEDNDLDYTAVVTIKGADGKDTVISHESNNKGVVRVPLNTSGTNNKISIELTNKKEVTIDVGVDTQNQAPFAVLSLIIPAIWLAYRYRRKRKGGEIG